MGRKNNHKNHSQSRRIPREERGRVIPPRQPVEALVVPLGRCFHRSRNGKLRFAKEDAAKALSQAQANRVRTGSAHMEQRAYHCADGCGDWHLTSRMEHYERSKT